MVGKKIIKVGVDLDGVIAKHSLGGFWVWLRRFKEKILKKTANFRYYYPSSLIELIGWKVINWHRVPSLDRESIFSFLAAKKEIRFYLVTSRFRFLEDLTLRWLKKYELNSCFHQILINIEDQNPLVYKSKAIQTLDLDFFIDDDLEVIDYLKKKTKARLYWIVPGHRKKSDNHDDQVETCQDFAEALKKIFGRSSI